MSSTQVANPGKVALDASYLQLRNDPAFAWSRAVSMALFYPKLAGFWPVSVVNENDDLLDLSGNGQLMTNTGGVDFGLYGITPYAQFDGTNYFTTPDAGVNSPISDLFFATWVKFNVLGTEQGLVNKWGAAGNRSFRFYKKTSDQLGYSISSNGTAIASGQSNETFLVDTWYRVMFAISSTFAPPNPYIRGWINGKLVIAGSTNNPACFGGCTAALELGSATGGGANSLNGYMSLPIFGLSGLLEAHSRVDFDYTRPLFGVTP